MDRAGQHGSTITRKPSNPLTVVSKSAHARPFVAELRPMRTQLTAPTPNTLIATVYGHCKDSAAQTHYGTVDNHDDEHVGNDVHQ